jgi:hypothetical protein
MLHTSYYLCKNRTEIVKVEVSCLSTEMLEFSQMRETFFWGWACLPVRSAVVDSGAQQNKLSLSVVFNSVIFAIL